RFAKQPANPSKDRPAVFRRLRAATENLNGGDHGGRSRRSHVARTAPIDDRAVWTNRTTSVHLLRARFYNCSVDGQASSRLCFGDELLDTAAGRDRALAEPVPWNASARRRRGPTDAD